MEQVSEPTNSQKKASELDFTALCQRVKEQTCRKPVLHAFGKTKEWLTDMLKAHYYAEVGRRNVPLQKELADKFCEQVAGAICSEKYSGLILVGGVGCGKSTMATALLRVFSVLRARTKYCRAYESLINGDLGDIVLIDDIGTENVTTLNFGNESRPFVDWVYRAYDLGVCFVITTNLAPSEIEPRYGARVADRLRETACVISMDNGSFRAKK